MKTKLLVLLAATSLTVSSAIVCNADTAATKDGASQSQTKGGSSSVNDPAAEQLIDKMTHFYRKMQSVSASMDADQEEGNLLTSLKIHQTCQMKLEHNNRAVLRAETPQLTQNLLSPAQVAKAKPMSWSSLNSDGKSTYMYRAADNRYVKAQAPATFGKLLAGSLLMEGHGDIGLTCVLSLLDDKTNKFTTPKLAGTETIDGVETQHVVVGGDFPIDLYIQTGDKPWLKQFVIKNKESGPMSLTCKYGNWQENPTIDRAEFGFVPPSQAKEVD